MSIEDRFLPELEPILREVTQATGRAFEFHDSSQYRGGYDWPPVPTAHAFTVPDRRRPGVELVYIEDSEVLSPRDLTIVAAHEVVHFKLDAEGYWRLYSRVDDPTENSFADLVSLGLADLMVDTYLIEMKLSPWHVIQSDLPDLLLDIQRAKCAEDHADDRLTVSRRIVTATFWRLHAAVPQAERQQLIESLEEKFPDIARRASTLARRIREIGLTRPDSYEKCLWLLTDRLWGNRRPFEIRPWR